VTQRRGLNNLDLSAVIGTQTPVSSLPILDKKKKKRKKKADFSMSFVVNKCSSTDLQFPL
jgi:hypothetical protein